MEPSAWRQLDPHPALRRLVKVQLDMQFGDLRTLLRLPVPEAGLDAGCNLTTAALAFNLVSGASVLFFESSVKALTQFGDRGRRFKDVFGRYYPWSEDELSADEAAPALYEWARNPLTHSLGVGKDRRVFPGAPVVQGHPVAVMFDKGPLPPDGVRELATMRERHPALAPTVVLHNKILDVNVMTLGWGVHELLRRLFEDEEQVRSAEETAQQLLDSAS